MTLFDPWWLLPAILFVVPLAVGLIYNAGFKHKYGVSQHVVLGLIILSCWTASIVLILRAVR